MDILLIPLSLLIGLVAAMLGVGGGVFMVPVLILMGVDAHSAVALSIGAVTLTSLSAFTEYFKQKTIDMKLALFLACFSIPGAIIGTYLNQMTDPILLQQLFGGFLLLMAGVVWNRKWLESRMPTGSLKVKRKVKTKDGKEYNYGVPVLLLAPVSIIAGVLAGFFGIGGGIVKVPAMILSGIPTHISIATSTSLVTLNSGTALLSHGAFGSELIYLLFIGPTLIVGAQIGARLSKKMKGEQLQKVFTFVLVLFSLALFMKT
jgi:uncharacterized membrane protein YfcA